MKGLKKIESNILFQNVQIYILTKMAYPFQTKKCCLILSKSCIRNQTKSMLIISKLINLVLYHWFGEKIIVTPLRWQVSLQRSIEII